VIESEPSGRNFVVSVALPVESSTTEFSERVPFLNVTFPVGVAEPVVVTTAVSKTACPNEDGLGDVESAVVVEYSVTFCGMLNVVAL
jgi:hypothetical protein